MCKSVTSFLLIINKLFCSKEWRFWTNINNSSNEYLRNVTSNFVWSFFKWFYGLLIYDESNHTNSTCNYSHFFFEHVRIKYTLQEFLNKFDCTTRIHGKKRKAPPKLLLWRNTFVIASVKGGIINGINKAK